MMMKGMSNDGEMVNQVGLSRKHIFDAVDASVERLGTYIDVLQIHRLDRDTPREEIMKALNDVVVSGKVRYIGSSSVRVSFSKNPNPLISGGFSLIVPVRVDACMGIPSSEQHCREAWVGEIHQHAKLLQPAVS